MRIDIITLFPNMLEALNYGITGRAIKKDLLTIRTWNPRDYTNNNYGSTDDRPYGGGPGMVMTMQPLQDTINAVRKQYGEGKVLHLSPQGHLLDQVAAKVLSASEHLILLTGRYEGIDERLLETEVDEEWSIGDYVLSGGELPAMVLIDTITRLLPGVLGDEASAKQDSFSQGLLDYPHYTRPEDSSGQSVPKILLSGNHEAIARWRLKQSLGRTWLRRPDLLKKRKLTAEEQVLLDEFINSSHSS